MNRHIRVLHGLHTGAEVELAPGTPLTIGSDTSCTIVLCDPGVSARHCVVTVDDYGVTCRTLQGSLGVANRMLGPGGAIALEDFHPFHIGRAALSIGPAGQSADSRWLRLERAVQEHRPPGSGPARVLKRMNPYALFAALVVGIGGAISIAYATLSSTGPQFTAPTIDAARQWLQSVAPADSELSIGMNGAQTLVLSGYVSSSGQREVLADAARRTPFNPRVDVYATDQLLESFARLSRLEGLDCEPHYRSGGHVVCASAAASDTAASALRRIARDVPGLTSLEVAVAVPDPPAAAPAATAPVPVSTPAAPQLTRKFSVLIYRQQRFLVGQFGDKYAEGDIFDGLKINHIDVDEVIFERDGRQYPFRVAALSARQ
ncbi:MAG TPA: FHA domain-containing protein [Povalibacter sp.]|nr:FHA domain-containing protein [Povalibacter sp.]